MLNVVNYRPNLALRKNIHKLTNTHKAAIHIYNVHVRLYVHVYVCASVRTSECHPTLCIGARHQERGVEQPERMQEESAPAVRRESARTCQ